MTTPLNTKLPWTTSPLIVNAPMAGFAGSKLAVAVSKAGGLGQIGVDNNMKKLEQQLSEVAEAFDGQGKTSQTLPIGVGLLTFILEIEQPLSILKKYKPAVIWLFASKQLSDYATWTTRLRSACPQSQIWVQLGSVAGALELAEICRPDALIMQGADAGGHGFEKGAGIISLLPEAADTLSKNGYGDIPLLASGGIVDGRGAAAALSLGAQGVVLGTRFLAAQETDVHPRYQEAVIAATDGGQTTVRAKLFDNLRGPNIWPVEYDGRGLRTRSHADHEGGVSIDEIRRLHSDALKEKDLGWGETNRATIWAGTGVGLVQRVQPAAEIVEEVRSGVKQALEIAKARL